jgi:hypothetical protein
METKEILTTLGLDPAKITTTDEFKSAMETDFVRKSEIDKHPEIVDGIIRNKMGSVQHKFITELKSIGIELTPEEMKDKRLSDLISYSLPKVKESFQGKITELEKKAGTGSDERVKALEAEKEKLAKDYTDLKGVNSGLATEFQTFKDQIESDKKKSKINNAFDSEYSKYKFKDGMTNIEHNGFKSELQANYKFELNDAGTFDIRDSAGKVIFSKKTVGQPITLAEILDIEAEKNGLKLKTVGKTGGSPKPVDKKDNNDAPVVVGGRERIINFAARESRPV